jgi:4-hydroxybenzoate polyprenyltransferase
LRPHQWVKNLFVFLPVFFSGQLTEWQLFYPTLIAFVVYCFVASAIYCFNDIWDVDADRVHPEKRKRPIASGAISKSAGYIIMFFCLLAAFSLLLWMKFSSLLVFLFIFYFLLNIAYCIKLKQIALIDVFVVAIGFVLRITVGGLSAQVWISHWIILMTFLLALFLAFAKRRDDFLIYEQTNVLARKNIVKYNFEFLNAALTMISTITIVAYIMYSVSPEVNGRFGSNYLYITTVFVLAGILRYLQLTFVLGKSGNPTKILYKDRFVLLCVLFWIGTFVIIIYL